MDERFVALTAAYYYAFALTLRFTLRVYRMTGFSNTAGGALSSYALGNLGSERNILYKVITKFRRSFESGIDMLPAMTPVQSCMARQAKQTANVSQSSK